MPPNSLLKVIFFVPLLILILERVLGTAKFQNDFFGYTERLDLSLFDSPLHSQINGGNSQQKSQGSDQDATNVEPKMTESSARVPPRRRPDSRIPLNQLVDAEDQSCENGLTAMVDKHIPYDELLTSVKIPRIVHQTSKSRCLTKKVHDTVNYWFLADDWAHYFHSDIAIENLFAQDWPEFPHLQMVLKCIDGKGTMKADLWRYLILWEYGGVYADVDSKPAKFNATTITAEDDGFFVVEQYHILSQYFMATSPRHPIMFYTIHHVLSKLLDALDVGVYNVPLTTGPHSLNQGFQSFMKDKGVKIQPAGVGKKPAKAGHWIGTENRSITVVGVGENENEYVIREFIRRHIKSKEYETMGMRHFMIDSAVTDKSCMSMIWEAHRYSMEKLQN